MLNSAEAALLSVLKDSSFPSQHLQQNAGSLLATFLGLQCCPGCHLKDFPHTVFGFGRTLLVAVGTDAVCHLFAIFIFNWFLQINTDKFTF